MRRSEIGGVATIDLCHPAQAQRLDIVAQQRTRFGAIVDEQRKAGAARHGLDAERPGAGEQVEHARAFDRVVVGVDQDVEHGFAQAVRRRTDLLRGGRSQITALQSSTDDTHRPTTRPAASDRACRDSHAGDGAAGRSRWPLPRCGRGPPRCRCAAPARGGPCGPRSARFSRPA